LIRPSLHTHSYVCKERKREREKERKREREKERKREREKERKREREKERKLSCLSLECPANVRQTVQIIFLGLSWTRNAPQNNPTRSELPPASTQTWMNCSLCMCVCMKCLCSACNNKERLSASTCQRMVRAFRPDVCQARMDRQPQSSKPEPLG
jgi:hypothetical protein